MQKMQIFLLFFIVLAVIQAQNIQPGLIYPNLVNHFNMSSLEIRIFRLHFARDQAGMTLSLSFIPIDFSQIPNFSVRFSFNNTGSIFSNLCENPLSNNHSCFYEIPIEAKTMPELDIQIKCISLICDLKAKPIINQFISVEYETPQLEELKGRSIIMGFNVNKTMNFNRIIFSIRAHNIKAHEIFQNNDLYTYFRISSGHPIISYVADRIIFIFQAGDPELCSDCRVQYVFCSERYLVFEVVLSSYSDLKELALDGEYVDFLTSPGLTNTYKLSLDNLQKLIDDQNKLFFSLITFTGSSKSMFVHGDYQPTLLKDYQYNSTLLDYYEEEDIIITMEDLQLSGFQGQTFYILINGDHEGLYKLDVRISDALMVALSLGMSETRAIKADELHYYKLNLWNSASDDGDLLLKLTVESGNIEIYGRVCSYNITEDCPIITESDITSKNRIDYQGDSKEGNKMLRFPSKCSEFEIYCFLQFMVKGYNSTFLGLNRYTLLIMRENAIITLLENVRHDSHIELNNRLRYQLSINDPNNIIEIIKFRINADLPYYVTKNIPCFELECVEEIGTARNPVIFSNGSFSGIYYLFVDGLKSSDFSIFPEVVRKGAQILEIPLSEGKSFKGILNENTETMVFSFIIESEEEFDVEVILQGAKNKLEIQVFNGKSSNFGWSSTSNLIQFKHSKTDDNFYRIVIRSHEADLHISSLEFRLFYATDKTLRSIEKNKIVYETMKALGSKYYIFYADMDEDACIVTKHIINPLNLAINIELYLSSNPYPDQNSYIYKAEKAETSRIILKNDEIINLCVNNSNPHHCPIYLSVYNSNPNEEIIYSLLVHFQNKAIEILEGHEQRFLLNQNEEILRGYFLPNNKNSSLDLYFYTENVKFEVFLNIFDDRDNLALSHNYFNDFPNKTSHLFYLHENYQTSLVIKPKSLEFCWPNCVLLFTITYNLASEELASLTILITSNYTEIHEGKSLAFSLVQEEFKYFYFNLEKFLQNPAFPDNSSLILSLTSFYGYAYVYVNIAHHLKNEKPTYMETDYYVYDGHFTITKEEILNSLEKHISNTTKLFSTAKLIIGVFSDEYDGKFMLNVLNSINALQSIYTGTPQEIFLRNNTERYFQFYFGKQEKFKIFFNRETGVGVVGVLNCSFDSVTEDSELFKTCTSKIETGFKIISGTGSSFYEVTSRNSENFCQNCYFLIHIRSISGDLKGSLVIKEDDDTLISLQEGRKFYDHLNKQEESQFVFWSSGYEVIDVLITVFQGNPIIYYSPDFVHKRKDYSMNFTKNDNSSFINFHLPPKKFSYRGSNINKLDWEIPEEWGQYSDNYLLVYGNKTTCEYSISYVTSGAHVLQGGLIHMDALIPMNTKTYIYNHAENIEAHMTMNFDQIAYNYTEIFEFSVKFRQSNENSGFQEIELESVNLEKSFESANSIGYLIPSNKTGTYIFNLTSKNKKLTDKAAKYSIVVNSREISVIPYDTIIRTFILKKSLRFYETYISTSGFLVLELLECSGNLQVFTKDYESLLLEDFEEDFKPIVGQTFIHVMKVEPGMIYFAMQSHNEASIIDFSLKFYETYNKIPEVKYSLGNQGILDSVFNRHDETFKISFGGVMCEGCEDEDIKEVQIQYYILYSESSFALSAKGKCGVYSFGDDKQIEGEVFSKYVGKFPLTSNLLSADIKFDEKKVNFITLKASIQENENSSIFNIYYPIIEIHPINIHRWVFWLIITIILISLLICCGLSIHFFRKYRHAMKKLKYEMEDVRNIAQITAVNTTSIEMENKKYQGLVEN